jgi:hypothetical protein
MAERVGLRILNHSHLVSIVIVGVRHAPWLVMAFMSVLPRVDFGGWVLFEAFNRGSVGYRAFNRLYVSSRFYAW